MAGGVAMVFFLFLSTGWNKSDFFVVGEPWNPLRGGGGQGLELPFWGH